MQAILPAVLLLLAPAARADAPIDAHAFIARLVVAYGGWNRLQRVHAYRVEGRLFSVMQHREAPTVRVFARPDRMKVLIDYADGHEARLVDHGRCWRASGGGPLEPVGGPMCDATVLQAARAAVPWILYERQSQARLIEPFEQDSLRLPGVEIPLEQGLVLRVYVDPSTWRTRVSQGLLTHGGMQTHFETYYDDWRVVGGIRFAFREENWASGAHTGNTAIDKVVLDPPQAPDEFTPPGTSAKRPSRTSS